MAQPDIQRLVIDFLLDQDTADGRVYSALPKTKVWPAVRVTQFNDQPVTQRPLHLVATSLTVEAFAGPKKTAHDLAVACRTALHDSLVGTHDDAVVSAVDSFGLRDEPDETFTPALNRWLFTLTVHAHPLASVGS